MIRSVIVMTQKNKKVVKKEKEFDRLDRFDDDHYENNDPVDHYDRHYDRSNYRMNASRSAKQEHHHYHYKKLYRSTTDKWLGGVCGGIAEYYNKDPVLVRVLWIILAIFSMGVGIVAYLAIWLIVDKYPSYYTIPLKTVRELKGEELHYHHYYRRPNGGTY